MKIVELNSGTRPAAYIRWDHKLWWKDRIEGIRDAHSLRYPYHWEDDIIWGDAKNQDNSNSTNSHSGVIVRENKEISSGNWARAIVWNDMLYDPDVVAYMEKISDLVEMDEGVILMDELNLSEEARTSLRFPGADLDGPRDIAHAVEAAADPVAPSEDEAAEEEPERAIVVDTNDAISKKIKMHEKLERQKRDKQLRLENQRLRVFGKSAEPTDAQAAAKGGADDSATLMRRRQKQMISSMEHSPVALQHTGVRFSPRMMELRFFHRPRLAKGVQAWSVTVQGANGVPRAFVSTVPRAAHASGDLAGAALGTSSYINYTIHRVGMMHNRVDKPEDLCLYSGGDFVCLEYIEETPLVMLNIGMTFKMVNYYRCIRPSDTDAAAADGEAPPNAPDAADDGDAPRVAAKRVPRHLLGLQDRLKQGKGALGGAEDAANDSNDIPKLPEGVTEVLQPDDEFPFLGNISEGQVQSTIMCNLFRAPIFKHTPRPVDFLLIRNSQYRRGFIFVIKKIPSVFVVGQQEPHEKVPNPVRKQMNPFLTKFTTYHLIKHFIQMGPSHQVDVSTASIQKHFDPFYSKFKKDFLKCLREVAIDLDDDGTVWRRRPYDDLLYMLDRYGRLFTPEEVCLHEAKSSYEYKLARLGITQCLDISKIELCLKSYSDIKDVKVKRLKALEKIRSIIYFPSDPRLPALDRLKFYIEESIKTLVDKIETAKFIHERLVLSPWNLTESFIKYHLQRFGNGMLQLHGMGDPSGIGEGFSYCR